MLLNCVSDYKIRKRNHVLALRIEQHQTVDLFVTDPVSRGVRQPR